MSARFYQWLFGVVCLIYLSTWGGPLASPSSAIDIRFHLEGPSENPAWDPTGSILLSIFEAAASYWEPIFVDSRSMTVDIEWENDLDANVLGLWTYDAVGNNNIEINSNEAFWVDPTPLASEEFGLTQTLYEDLTATQQNDWYNGPVPGVLEVGWQGDALPGSVVGANHDLLSVCMHELGHELGVRSGVGPVFPVYPHQVGGAVGVEAVKHANGGHLADVHPLMYASFPTTGGLRRLPAAIDSLAVAHTAGYTTLMLPRTEFIGTSSDFSNSLNWIGGMTTSFVDATVRNGGSGLNPAASADMNFVNLTLTEGGYASTGSHVLDVAQTVTVDGAWALTPARLSVNPGGTLEADDVRVVNFGELVMWGGLAAIDRFEIVGPFTGQFAMLPGATLRVDRLIGFPDNLQFLGNLQIGNSGGGILNVGANQSLNVLGAMAVGPSPGGSGTVTISAGAQADSGPLSVGSNGASGTVLITGYDAGSGLLSDWDIGGDLTIGSSGIGAGTMTIQQYATCNVTGVATVRGSRDATSRLVVRSGGSLVVDDSLNILPFGRVEITGLWTELVADEIILSSGGVFTDGAGTSLQVNRLSGFGDRVRFAGSLEFGHAGGLAAYAVGAGQSLDVAEQLTIGGNAPAILNINNGGTVDSGRSFLAKELGSSGTNMSVAGGSRWHVYDELFISGDETGIGGSAVLGLMDNGRVDVDGLMKVWPGGTVNVGAATGGTLAVADDLRIPPGATVRVGSAGNLYADAIDLSGGGALSTTGPNATVYTNSFVGLSGDLTINGNLGVGWSGGSGIGAVSIGGSESLGVTGVLYLGDDSTGTLTVTHGAHAQFGQARVGDNGSGLLVVNGDTTAVDQNGDFSFGYFGSGANGALRVEGGAALTGNGHAASLGNGSGTTGTALITGHNSRWTDLSNLYVGGNATGPMGTGTLSVASGGRVAVNSTLQVWTTGRVELLGSEITTASFLVQNGGTFVHQDGTLTVDGGLFNPGTTYNYSIDGPTGSDLPTLVLKNVASANVPNTLFVGHNHAGQLQLESGAVMRSFNGRVGWVAGTSDGRVNVTGGQWINTADLEIGVRNYGEMVVSGGGTVRNTIGAVGAVPGSFGRVIVSSGGRWENSDALYVGGKLNAGGTGTLSVDNAQVTASTVTVWPQGTVSLANGSLETNSVTLTGGVLEGAGTLNLAGPFVNEGVVAPGSPLGAISARGGDYWQAEDGVLSIEIGGNRLVDQLSISGGSATLDGALHVALSGGYVPSPGSQFEILWAENRVFGQFDPLLSIFQPIGGGLGWQVNYRENNVVLQIVQAVDLEADFDEDGDVDGDDLARWQADYGVGTLHTQGDADGDLDVDGCDFLIWQRQFGHSAALVQNASIPEPATFFLALILSAFTVQRSPNACGGRSHASPSQEMLVLCAGGEITCHV